MQHIKKVISAIFGNHFAKSEFVKNSFYLTAGTAFAQMIPILISPVLTRLYKPEDYGLLSLFSGIAGLFGIISTARYEMAIVLPVKDRDSINIISLSFIITVMITGILFPVMFFWNDAIAAALNAPEISAWLCFVPVVVFFTGFCQILNYWSIRTKQFKNLAFSKISQTLAGSSTNLIFGFQGFGVLGLILSGILGQAVSAVTLFSRNIRRFKTHYRLISKKEILRQAELYKDFPRINSLHALLDVLRDSMTIFLISYLFNSSVLGFYSFTLRILKTPASLVASSVSQVFFQKASELNNGGTNLRSLVRKMIIRLSLIFLPFFAILFFFAPALFNFVFGDKWSDAGDYTQILTPWLFLNFIASPISQIPIILGRQKSAFGLSIIGSSLMILSVVAGGFVFKDIFAGLCILSLTQSLFTIYVIYWTCNLAKKEVQ